MLHPALGLPVGLPVVVPWLAVGACHKGRGPASQIAHRVLQRPVSAEALMQLDAV